MNVEVFVGGFRLFHVLATMIVMCISATIFM